MYRLEAIKNELKALIANGGSDLPKVMDKLMRYTSDTNRQNELTLLRPQAISYHRRFLSGLALSEEENTGYARIRLALLDWIDRLTNEEIDACLTTAENNIKELGIQQRLGTIYLVNCNRQTVRDKFWDDFDPRRSIPYQFYFIVSCPTQQPDSFSERLIYEIIQYELEDEMEAISFERELRSARGKEIERVKLVNLPLGPTLESSKSEFRKYFSKRFNTAGVPFEDFVASEQIALQYRYTAFLFQLESTKWRPFLPDYFEWIIQTFSLKIKGAPTYLFFFVINTRDAHIQIDDKIAQPLNLIAQNHTTACTIFPQLNPVVRADLSDWLRDINVRNERKIEDFITTFVSSLPPNKRDQIDMTDIESLQELIYWVSNK